MTRVGGHSVFSRAADRYSFRTGTAWGLSGSHVDEIEDVDEKVSVMESDEQWVIDYKKMMARRRADDNS